MAAPLTDACLVVVGVHTVTIGAGAVVGVRSVMACTLTAAIARGTFVNRDLLISYSKKRKVRIRYRYKGLETILRQKGRKNWRNRTSTRGKSEV